MLGKRSDQKGLGKRTGCIWLRGQGFYGLLASLRGQLFSDDDFAEIYCPTMDGTACRPACRTHGHERGAKNGWKACDRRVEVQENVRLRVLR